MTPSSSPDCTLYRLSINGILEYLLFPQFLSLTIFVRFIYTFCANLLLYFIAIQNSIIWIYYSLFIILHFITIAFVLFWLKLFFVPVSAHICAYRCFGHIDKVMIYDNHNLCLMTPGLGFSDLLLSFVSRLSVSFCQLGAQNRCWKAELETINLFVWLAFNIKLAVTPQSRRFGCLEVNSSLFKSRALVGFRVCLPFLFFSFMFFLTPVNILFLYIYFRIIFSISMHTENLFDWVCIENINNFRKNLYL